MHAILTVVEGAFSTRLLLRLPTLIGRSVEADLKVRASRVSRQHCEIYEFEHELVVKDLGSSNGTFVNDERIEGPTFLSPGDELRVGGITFRADYELPEVHPVVRPPNALPVAGEAQSEDDPAPSSQFELIHTEQGSFIRIDESAAADPDDSKLNEFLQDLG